MSSSSSPTQDNPEPQYPSTTPSSPGQEEVTDSEKRSRSQLEKTAKVGRRSTSTTDISSALPRAQYNDSQSSESFLSSYSETTQLPSSADSMLLAQDLPTLEHALQTLRMRRLDDYRQAVYIPPMAKPGLKATDDTLFPLVKKVEDFLAGYESVMLVLGDSGAGKSTFNRYLEHQLWQEYRNGGPIPLFISLPALDRPDKNLVVEQLRIFDFTEEEIRQLKQHRQFVLICDGYDEGQLTCNLHTTNLLDQSGQWRAKLVVTCRTQYLGHDYRDQFVPKVANKYQRAANSLFQEAVIAPFSKEQIEDYVERYVPLEPRTWAKEDYMSKLTAIPGLMELVKNPFLLTLCLEALPSVVQGKSDLSSLRVTRVQLYDIFVEHWLGANKRRLQDQKLRADDQAAFFELKEDGFEQSAIDFQKGLAAAIFTHQDGRPIVEYIPRNDKNSWKAEFFNTEPRRALLRLSCLLSRAGNQYRFIHRSVLEYFYSCTICSPSTYANEFAPQVRSDSTDALALITDHPLSKRSLVTEPSIVQFLAERVQTDPEFERQLRALLERSKTDEHASQAAANAITILVRAGVQFNGDDLRDIQIPGADVSGGQFDSVQFQRANLEGVNLTQCWIRRADLRNVRMKGAQFGEMSYLEEAGAVTSCAYSSDGRAFAVGLKNGDINMYDTATWANIRTLKNHHRAVRGLAFLSGNGQILSSSLDNTVCLWDCETGVPKVIKKDRFESELEKDGSRRDRTVTFSPCGNLIAFVSEDMPVQQHSLLKESRHWSSVHVKQWDIRTAASISFSPLHPISVMAYSPDSKHIAVGGLNGLFKTFDTQTGLHILDYGYRHIFAIGCVAYSSDGMWIVAGTDEGNLQLCRARGGLPGYTWEGHDDTVSGVTFSTNSRWIASCSRDKSVKLWSADTRTLVSVFIGHSDLVCNVVFSPDGSQLASSSHDETVRFWEVDSLEADHRPHNPSASVTSVAYSSDGQRLVFGSRDGSARVCNADTGESELVVFSDSRILIKCVAFSPDGLRFAIATDDGCVTFWDTTGSSSDMVLVAQNQYATPIALSPCGHWIVTSTDNTSQLWDASSGQPGQILTGHTRPVTSVSFSPSGHRIVSGCRGGSIRIWGIGTTEPREIVTGTDGEISVVAYSPVASQIAASFKDVVQIWDEQSGDPLQRLEQTGDVSTFAFSSCGSWIAVGCRGFVSLWTYGLKDLRWEWRHMVVVRGFIGDVVALAWRPSKLEFVTGSEDKATRVWRLQNDLGKWSVYLVWSSGPAALVADGALIVNAVGLSTAIRQFLKQRGALDGLSFAEMDDDDDGDDDEKLLLPEEPESSEPSEPSDTSSEEDWNSEDFEGSDGSDSGNEEPTNGPDPE